MPRKRRAGIRRIPAEYVGIDRAERMQWCWPGPLVGGKVLDDGARLTNWPDWATWFAVYERCRDEFLADQEESRNPGHAPFAEIYYWAMRAGLDPESVAVPSTPDPRYGLAADYRSKPDHDYDALLVKWQGDIGELVARLRNTAETRSPPVPSQ